MLVSEGDRRGGRRRTLHGEVIEREDFDVLLVHLTHAKVRVVRRNARLAQALVVIGRPQRLAPGNLRVASEVLDHEATAHDARKANSAPQRDDLQSSGVR